MNNQVAASLIPFVAMYVKKVEATFIAPSAEKQRLCVGTLGTFYKTLKNQPVAWETIEPSVCAMVPVLVEYYNSIGAFKHNVQQQALADIGEPHVVVSKPSRMQWVDQIPVYEGCVPRIEPDLDALPESLQAAIDEAYSIN